MAGGTGVFVGVAILDEFKEAQAFLERHRLPYPAAFDQGNKIMERYQVTGLPTSIFIDPAGTRGPGPPPPMDQPAPRPRPLSIPLLQVLTALVLMALGFLVVIQSRAGRALVAQPEVPTRNVYALATLLREEREAHVALEAEVAELRQRLEVYERAAAEGQSLTAAMSKELETLRAAVGLKAMEGPGGTVTMRDSPHRPAGRH